jgi:methylated-DNA-[protein]-cysteine S-methyltransferase
MERAYTRVFSTPLGWAGVVATEKCIVQVVLPRKNRYAVEREIRNVERRHWDVAKMHTADSALLTTVVKLLKHYLSGKPVSFDLPVDLHYYTNFQQAVWRAAAKIPRGETRSYAWIATRIKRPKAVRAVGQALGANPIPLLIP